jgi:hypothetical protein
MGTEIKDKDPNFGTIFLIILLLLFALVYSDRSESKTLQSSGYSLQNDLTPGSGSLHLDASIPEAVDLTVLFKNSIIPLNNASFNLFSSELNIDGYNQMVTCKFTDLQKITLAIKPLFLFRLSYHLSLSEKEDLPFLS